MLGHANIYCILPCISTPFFLKFERPDKGGSYIEMGSGQIFELGRVNFFLCAVGSGKPSLVWVWKISPENAKFSIFFPSGQKISCGQIKKYLGQRRVSLLFTASQKYAQVGSGLIQA